MDKPQKGQRQKPPARAHSQDQIIRPSHADTSARIHAVDYSRGGERDSIVRVQPRYENFIGGKWLAPVEGRFRVNLTPATARPICEVADSTPADVELALDAAHAAKDAWG
jgi:hypothetical protein